MNKQTGRRCFSEVRTKKKKKNTCASNWTAANFLVPVLLLLPLDISISLCYNLKIASADTRRAAFIKARRVSNPFLTTWVNSEGRARRHGGPKRRLRLHLISAL